MSKVKNETNANDLKTGTIKNNSFIATDESMRETINHGNLDYPFAYYLEDVWAFDLHCVDWHWHPELEFVYVQSGTMYVFIGSEKFTIGPNTGLFINTRVIHRFESEKSAVIPNIVFSPKLLAAEDSLIYQKYIAPILSASAPYQIYTTDIPWQKSILDVLKQLFALQHEPKVNELKTTELLLCLWNLIFENTAICNSGEKEKPEAGKQAQLQVMMQYIQNNYQNAITLDDIAASVLISKSGALKLFARFLHTSPVAYLVRYRLQRAANLLVSTEKTIVVIAQETGFSDSAYFCRKFKELYQLTPTEYRRQQI